MKKQLPRLDQSKHSDDQSGESGSGFLLNRDLPTAVFPFASRKAQVSLTDNSPAMVELVTNALRPDAENLHEAVAFFFHECAARLLYEGQCVFEIRTSVEPEPPGQRHRLAQLNLSYGPVRTVELEWHRLDQLRIRSNELYVLERSFPQPPTERMLTVTDYILIDCPKALHTDIRVLCKEINRIEKESTELTSKYFRQTAESLIKQNRTAAAFAFDFDRHRRYGDCALLYAASELGWNYEGLISTEVTLYYLALRRLRFEKYLAILRSAILIGVNESLTKAGAKLGFAAELKIAGVPSAEDVEKSTQQLKNGMAVSEVLYPFKY